MPPPMSSLLDDVGRAVTGTTKSNRFRFFLVQTSAGGGHWNKRHLGIVEHREFPEGAVLVDVVRGGERCGGAGSLGSAKAAARLLHEPPKHKTTTTTGRRSISSPAASAFANVPLRRARGLCRYCCILALEKRWPKTAAIVKMVELDLPTPTGCPWRTRSLRV